MKINYLLGILMLILLASCSEDENVIGGSIRPPKDEINVSYVDSIGFKAFSYIPDVFRTDGGISGYDYFVFGGFKPDDIPQASEVKADIAMEFWYDELEIEKNNDSSLVLDSVILLVLYDGYYGDTLANNYLEVFELNKRLSLEQEYYSNENPLDYYNEDDKIGELAYNTFDYDIPDSVRKESGYLNTLNIPIKKEVGQRIIDNLDAISGDLEAFRDLFKGVYIKSSVGTKALIYIYPFKSSSSTSATYTDFSALNLIYHYENEGSEQDSTLYYTQSIICNNRCGRFNVIRKEEGSYDYSLNETTVQPEVLYLQGVGVSNIKIQFPAFSHMSAFKPVVGEDSSRIAINSAKLVFTVDQNIQNPENYLAPYSLQLRRDTVGGFTYIPDELIYLSQNKSYTSGYRTTDYTYEFNIAEYVQEIIDAEEENPDALILSVSGNKNNPGFAFLKGVTNQDNLKLEIIYTRY